jgi:hypothetical protein
MPGQYNALRELVRTSKLLATVEPNQTVHTRPFGRRRHEVWIRDKMLGHGGYGVVWLERMLKAEGDQAELRAVKSIRIAGQEVELDGGQYVRELEALIMFSQDKVSGSLYVPLYRRHCNTSIQPGENI